MNVELNKYVGKFMKLIFFGLKMLLFVAVFNHSLAAESLIFGPPSVVNSVAASDSGYDQNFDIAAGAHGVWISVWESSLQLRGTDKDILISRSTDSGMTWSQSSYLAETFQNDAEDDVAPAIDTDGAESWIVVWSSGEYRSNPQADDDSIYFVRSMNSGTTWSEVSILNKNFADADRSDYNPSIKAGGDGLWICTWTSNSSDADIYHAITRDDGASWSDPRPINSNHDIDTGFDYNSTIETDGNGIWMVAWTSTDELGGLVGTDPDIFYSRSINNGLDWSDVAYFNPYAPDERKSDEGISIASDKRCNWVTIWSSGYDPDDVYGADLDIYFMTSSDSGESWSSYKILNSSALSDGVAGDYAAKLITDGHGSWLAAWFGDANLDDTVGNDLDILYTFSNDGGKTWAQVSILNTNAASDSRPDYNPAIATDGAGRWVAGWESEEDLGGNIGTDRDILFANSFYFYDPFSPLIDYLRGISGGDVDLDYNQDGNLNIADLVFIITKTFPCSM